MTERLSFCTFVFVYTHNCFILQTRQFLIVQWRCIQFTQKRQACLGKIPNVHQPAYCIENIWSKLTLVYLLVYIWNWFISLEMCQVFFRRWRSPIWETVDGAKDNSARFKSDFLGMKKKWSVPFHITSFLSHLWCKLLSCIKVDSAISLWVRPYINFFVFFVCFECFVGTEQNWSTHVPQNSSIHQHARCALGQQTLVFGKKPGVSRDCGPTR